MKTKTCKCIACNGKGHVTRKYRQIISQKTKSQIYKLYRKGLGIREIARMLKIKSPGSVTYAIKTANIK